MSHRTWPDPKQLLEMSGGFRSPCVIGAAAELDLFTRLADRALSAEVLAAELDGDLRAMRILLDCAGRAQSCGKKRRPLLGPTSS